MEELSLKIDESPGLAKLQQLGLVMDKFNRSAAPDSLPTEFKVFEIFRANSRLGFCYGYNVSKIFFLDVFYLRRDERGRGLGSEFLNRVETSLHQRGILRIMISTADFQGALGFWQRSGFAVLWQFPGGDDHILYGLTKSLDGKI